MTVFSIEAIVLIMDLQSRPSVTRFEARNEYIIKQTCRLLFLHEVLIGKKFVGMQLCINSSQNIQ